MRVKIRGEYYDSTEEPIMVEFSEKEKHLVKAMIGTDYKKMCRSPKTSKDEQIKAFMDLTEEEETRFTKEIR